METEDTLVQSIYYGKIGSEATERLLARFGRDGSFLLRDSETLQGAFCLCVRKTPFVHTYRLSRSTNGWYLQISRESQLRFRTLRSLIEHYRRTRSNNDHVVQLVDPLHKRVDEGIAYMEMNTSGTSTQ